VDLSFKAKEGSGLAKDIEAAGKAKTIFGGLATSKDAVSINWTINLPEELKKAIGPAIEGAVKDAIEKETDPAKKTLAKRAAETLMPTLKAGELDAGASFRGPNKDGHYTVVGGVKVKDGRDIEALIRDVLKNVPEKDKGKIELDAASVGGVKIHKITAEDMGEEPKKIFGSNAVYVAFRDDALIVAVGADGLAAIKEAAMLTPSTSKAVVNVAIAVGRLAGLDLKDQKAAKAAKEVFGSDPAGSDAITITATMTDRVHLKVNVKAKIISFGAKAAINAKD
jgi:hypothetical protein